MPDQFYPSVQREFLEELINATGKLASGGILRAGDTTLYILNGDTAIFKRTISIRVLDGQVCFEQATGLALRFHFMPALLEWLEKNKYWKSGGYIVPPPTQSISQPSEGEPVGV